MSLPNWPGAQVCYRRANHMLTIMSKEHVSIVRGKCHPSDEMNDLIDALNKGDEVRIKAAFGKHREEFAKVLNYEYAERTLVTQMLAGHAIVVSLEMLEALEQTGQEVRSARNLRRVGVRDEYVAWIGHENQPSDLEFRSDGFAYTKLGKYQSEIRNET